MARGQLRHLLTNVIDELIFKQISSGFSSSKIESEQVVNGQPG